MSTQIVERPVDLARAFLAKPEFVSSINSVIARHCTADRMLGVALSACLTSPKLLQCFVTAAGLASIASALRKSAQMGLEIDGRQGHLMPFKKGDVMIAQFVPGYQGLIDLAYNHPKVKAIWWNVVYTRDFFEFEDGLNRKLVHKKYEGDEDPGALRYAYAVCELEGGAKTFVCPNRREIYKVRASSAAWRYAEETKEKNSLWHTNEEAMWGKTSVRQLAKGIPQSNELRMALAEDDVADR